MQKIVPCLWFDHQAEEAARLYTSIFPDSRIVETHRYGDAAAKAAHKPAGSVMTVTFEIQGQTFVAMNGGPTFKFTEAVSFMVKCETQEEIDRRWGKLSEGGEVIQCGWLRDRFGLVWQIVPAALGKMLSDKDAAKVHRVMEALLLMKKIDLSTLTRAYDGP